MYRIIVPFDSHTKDTHLDNWMFLSIQRLIFIRSLKSIIRIAMEEEWMKNLNNNRWIRNDTKSKIRKLRKQSDDLSINIFCLLRARSFIITNFFFFLYQKSLHSVRCLKKMRNLDLLEQRQAKNCVDYF